MTPHGSAPETPAAAATKSAGRPRKVYRTGAVTTWLRRGSILLTLGSTLALLIGYATLPNEIPIHFNLAGVADGWGPKRYVFVLVGVFGALVFGSAWLSTKPHLFNYPTEITESNAQAIYREGERMVVWAALAISLLTVSFALSTLLALDLAFFNLLMIAALLGATGVGVVRIINAARRLPAP